MAASGTYSTPAAFIDHFNRTYQEKHRTYENAFWATKMNLKGCSSDELIRSKTELDGFLGDKKMLEQVRKWMASPLVTPDQLKTLKIFERTFLCYIIEDPKALAMREKINELEAKLAEKRNQMNLGYRVPGKDFQKASSVTLRNLMRTSESVDVRKACYEGLRSIGPFVTPELCEIVKLRNRLAKSLNYECFYDMKVSQAEGFDKKALFAILDDLEERSRPLLQKALKTLSDAKGVDALLPYNIIFALSGETAKLKDPYFPFENAVDVWSRSFAALGIEYAGSTMQLDLCDRPGKYSNGFCHWPQPAWESPEGWVPSQANFTSLASPKEVGSGLTALVTLMHEGGHAAHFANVVQPSPLFSQERAPSSVAYAETQSMFLDSLVSDAAWMARYAKSKDTGEVIPFDLIKQDIASNHPYAVFALRAMLAVPLFERRLYDLDEKDVTVNNIIELADEVERSVQGGLAARPLLSVPHLLSDESAAYYHGYVLADMGVYQTRAHFLKKYPEQGIVDNPNVGKDLREVYWKAGNSEKFFTLVQNLTGKPLSCDAWLDALQIPVQEKIAREREEYNRSVKIGPTYQPGSDVDLDMRIKLVHGDEVIADTKQCGSLAAACDVYRHWIANLK